MNEEIYAEDHLSTIVYVQVLNQYVFLLKEFPLGAGDCLHRKYPMGDGAVLFQFYVNTWALRQEQARFLMDIQCRMSKQDALHSYLWYTGPARKQEVAS